MISRHPFYLVIAAGIFTCTRLVGDVQIDLGFTHTHAFAPTLQPSVMLPPIPPPWPAASNRDATVPLYHWWVGMLADQPRPKRADEFLPHLKKIFAEEGVPEELAWISEVESTFNPLALNASGARGLFQFMPATAREQGLKLRPRDERVHPEKSARAAAALLRRLHATFDSWPLALAAYNAGEGRVRRALEAGGASTFAEIAETLPAETRLYVPRVLATLTVREGITPDTLRAPRPRLLARAGT